MLFQFTPIILLYGLVAVAMLYLSARTWTLRPTRGATAWSFTMLFCAIYAIGTGLEIAFAIPVWKLAMNRVIYIGITGFVFFWGIFAIRYSNSDRWLTRRTVLLLAIMPVVTLFLAFFAESHTLLYREYAFVRVDGLLMGQVVAYGVMFWVWLAYSYAIMVGSWLLMIHTAIRSHEVYRQQARIIVIASGLPVLIYTIQLFGIIPSTPFYPIAFAMGIAGVLMIYSMTRYRFMEVIPVAHDLIFTNVKTGIIVIDLKERIARMNGAAAQILGSSEKLALGLTLADALPQHKAIVDRFAEITEGKVEISFGTSAHYELQITPLEGYHGDIVGRLILFYDITERKKVEQQTLELSMERERVRLLKQFVSHMSHDLRTPLASLKMSQYILRRELGGEHSDRLDSLDRQTERLAEMVESMLTLLRLEEEELEGVSVIDANEIVGYVIVRHQKLASERGAQLEFSHGEDLSLVMANKDELTLALSNLVINAIYSAPEGGVTISTQREDDQIVISVRDSGIGIDAADLPHIFERFYRVDDARGTRNGGVGLGLTIAKAVVDRHAGTLDVKSQLGKGSEFTIRLPAAKSNAIPRARAALTR